jgi:hypothetical protein
VIHSLRKRLSLIRYRSPTATGSHRIQMKFVRVITTASLWISVLGCTIDQEGLFSPASGPAEVSAALPGHTTIDFEDLPPSPWVVGLPQDRYMDKGVILRNFHYASAPDWYPTHSGTTAGIAIQGLLEIALLRPARQVSVWIRRSSEDATFQCLNSRGQSVGAITIPGGGHEFSERQYQSVSVGAEHISRCFLFRIGVHEIDDISITWDRCELFEGSLAEFPLLNDPEVQAELQKLGRRTKWDEIISHRNEQGVWVVRNALGVRSFVEFEYEYQNYCLTISRVGQYERLLDAGYTIEAQIHTHPSSGFNGANPGGCMRLDGNRRRATIVEYDEPRLILEDGPSAYDKYLWRREERPSFPGFALDPEHLHGWYWDPQGNRMIDRKIDVTQQCLVGT